MHVSLEHRVCGEKQDRPEPVLVQNSGHDDDDIQISALDVLYEMDGRESHRKSVRLVSRRRSWRTQEK